MARPIDSPRQKALHDFLVEKRKEAAEPKMTGLERAVASACKLLSWLQYPRTLVLILVMRSAPSGSLFLEQSTSPLDMNSFET
jgi:hypothetical protein